jgi:hypothetical protein
MPRDFILYALLNSVNFFSASYIAILTIGISIICAFGRIKSLLIVLAVWSLAMVFNIGVIKLLKDALHFTI